MKNIQLFILFALLSVSYSYMAISKATTTKTTIEKPESEESAEECANEEEEDDESGKDRPCEVDDLDCIRNFFASNSNCRVSKEKLSNVTIPRFVAPLSAVNASMLLQNTKVYGSAKIIEFYQNKTSGNVVIVIKIKGFCSKAAQGFVSFHKKAKESVIVCDSIELKLGSVTITAVIPCVPSLRLHAADIHAYIDDEDIELNLGESFTESKSKQVQKALALYEEYPGLVVRERLAIEAPILMKYFIQKRLCYFGDKA